MARTQKPPTLSDPFRSVNDIPRLYTPRVKGGKTIGVKITDDMHAQLKATAEKNNMTICEVIRQLVDQGFMRAEQQQQYVTGNVTKEA